MKIGHLKSQVTNPKTTMPKGELSVFEYSPKQPASDIISLSPTPAKSVIPVPQPQIEDPAPNTSLPDAPPPPPAPMTSPQAKALKWMDHDWNLGPDSNSAALNNLSGEFPPSSSEMWLHPKPDSKLQTTAIVQDEFATYFVGGNNSKSANVEVEHEPLMAHLSAFADKPAQLKGTEQAKKAVEAMIQAADMLAMNLTMMAGAGSMMAGAGPMMGGLMGMAGMGMAGMGMSNLSSAPGTFSPTTFKKQAADLHEELHKKVLDAVAEAQLTKTQSASSIDSAQAATRVKNVGVPTCAGMTEAEIVAGVNKTLKSMDVKNCSYAVDVKLFAPLEKLDMNPVDFFTARACWQGVSTKRRALLEKVLDQFPNLPKDQKNWQSALAAVEASGQKVSETDRFFVGYFIDNRKKMKSLFRATLPSGFQGSSAVCYRGQDTSSQWGPHSTRPLGCYSTDPEISQSWAMGNFKRFKVKLNDIWSTYTTLQNNHRHERELTVYSPGGIRRGEPVKDLVAAAKEFNERYETDSIARGLENTPLKTYL